MSIKLVNQGQAFELIKNIYGSQHRKRRIYAFYSSEMNAIITDEHMMVLPVDERMATRAHAVFDVVYAKKLNIINLESHVSRLFKSASSIAITPIMSQEETAKIVHQVMSQLLGKLQREGMTVQKLKAMVFGIRMVISSGFGDFGIASIDKKPIFYVSVFQPYINYDIQKEGVDQYVVKFVKQPKQLVHSKTVDYTQNALMANQSKIRGGYQGIKALQNGILLEAAVANIAFVFGKEFATPRFETVIQGTTIKKLLKYLEQLKNQGVIQQISFRDITIEEAQNNATEMMVIGGDKIVPVLNFNGKSICKKKGPIATLMQDWYEKENENDFKKIVMEQIKSIS